MVQALADGNTSIQVMAAVALGDCNDTRAVGPLIQALKDNDGLERKKAAWALGSIKDTRAIEPLKSALNDECGYVPSQDEAYHGSILR